MDKFCRIVCLLMLLCIVPVAFGIRADAAQPDTAAEAMDYLEHYEDYVATDEDFERNLQSALCTVREEICSYATWISLLPPVIAITLALITKEVYSSLFLGILSGALIYSDFNLWGMVTNTFYVMVGKLSDPWNVGILIFLVVLGMMVNLVNKAGGSAAYGRWAESRIKSRKGAMLATIVLGITIFIDDYFNCLTVGSVMRPVTDKRQISRAKLAFLIDATAAPVCIIAPISSWAAAVSSVAPAGQGLQLFISSVPYNFYALLTIAMVFLMSLMDVDFGPMKTHEANAAKGDVYTTASHPYDDEDFRQENRKGTVMDLLLPVMALIVSCVLTMIYTGGFFDATSGAYMNFIDAFAAADASMGLVLGAFVALVITFCFYIPRQIIMIKEFTESFAEGFKQMVPAILILTFAWTLSGVTNDLGAKIFVAELVRVNAGDFEMFLPAMVYLVAVGLAFATGTSWGTFGVLLPIVCSVFTGGEMMVIAVSACLAGAVCGDHCSPISDTTIMASAGAQCDHINHVNTQLPYTLLSGGISFIGFALAGFIRNPVIVMAICLLLLAGILCGIRAARREMA